MSDEGSRTVLLGELTSEVIESELSDRKRSKRGLKLRNQLYPSS